MKQNILAPNVGESITEVRILKWSKSDGSAVKPGDVLAEIETDKATVEVAAESTGALKILKKEGETVPVGEVIALVDDAVQGTASVAPAKTTAPAATSLPKVAPANVSTSGGFSPMNRPSVVGPEPTMVPMGPAARHLAQEHGGAVTPMTAATAPARPVSAPAAAPTSTAGSATVTKDGPGDRRVPMTRLRARIAERLVQAQHTAAILTTFNEVDMTNVMKIRNQHKDAFKAKNGVNLSFMSFFTRACVMALKTLPAVNASIDGNDVVYHEYYDIGIAVGTDRGLVVPVLRGAESRSFLEIEKGIGELAEKARTGKLSIPEMSGGTFTITNGGTYGSLMSTPILNPPQSGILGMHKIQERPMAVGGKVEIRSMMYLALSYDHRLIDGKEAVTFLVTLKDLLENPEKLGLDFVS